MDQDIQVRRSQASCLYGMSNDYSKRIAKDLMRFKKYFTKEFKLIEQQINQFVEPHESIKQNYNLLLSIPGLNAVRNKLIHRIYAVIRRQTPYVMAPVF